MSENSHRHSVDLFVIKTVIRIILSSSFVWQIVIDTFLLCIIANAVPNQMTSYARADKLTKLSKCLKFEMQMVMVPKYLDRWQSIHFPFEAQNCLKIFHFICFICFPLTSRSFGFFLVFHSICHEFGFILYLNLNRKRWCKWRLGLITWIIKFITTTQCSW